MKNNPVLFIETEEESNEHVIKVTRHSWPILNKDPFDWNVNHLFHEENNFRNDTHDDVDDL